MPDPDYNAAIRAAGLFTMFGIVMAFVAGWFWVRRNDGEAEHEETQEPPEELIRAPGTQGVSDARSTPRGEREGAGGADGQEGEAL